MRINKLKIAKTFQRKEKESWLTPGIFTQIFNLFSLYLVVIFGLRKSQSSKLNNSNSYNELKESAICGIICSALKGYYYG